MNKNTSLILNGVLIVAVAVLYFLHFNNPINCTTSETKSDSLQLNKPVVLSPKEIKESKIVYVNLDVLNENYEYIKEVSASAKSDLKALENQYRVKAQKLEEDYAIFQQKAQQGLLSENQINTEQEAFMKRKEDLDQLEYKNQALMERIQEKTDEMNENLKAYIKEYNKQSNYQYVFAFSSSPLSQLLLVDDGLDITQEILEGLNAQYRASKAKK